MKKLILFLLVLLLPLFAVAQSARESLMADLQENVRRVGVNMDPYEYIPGPQTPAPKGYKPFYISHYGRHGSRSNWNKKGKYEEISALYHKADEAGLLTAAGKAAMQQIDTLIVLHDNMDGRLTELGAQEHRQIAHRMYMNYQEVFKKGSKKVTARSSVVPRVLVSMAAFTGELLSLQSDLEVRWDTGEEIMKIMSTDDVKPIRDSVSHYMKQWGKKHSLAKDDFMKKVFTNPKAAQKVIGSRGKFMNATMDMAMGCAAFGLDNRLFDLYTWDDLYYYQQLHAMKIYMRQCNSVEFGDERMKPVDLILRDIIEKADEAIATGTVAADFRFGHDYQLLATSSILNFEGVAERRSFAECEDWPAWRYTPFAGNFQLIFYRGKKGDVLVKVLLNERETAILGLEGFPYYKWEDVRALWSSRVRE